VAWGSLRFVIATNASASKFRIFSHLIIPHTLVDFSFGGAGCVHHSARSAAISASASALRTAAVLTTLFAKA